MTAAETMGTETGKKFNKIDIDRADVDRSDVDRLDIDRVDIDRVDTEERENTKDKEMKVFSSDKIIVDTKHVEKEKKEKEEGKEEENNEDQIIKSLDEGKITEMFIKHESYFLQQNIKISSCPILKISLIKFSRVFEQNQIFETFYCKSKIEFF